MRALLDLMRDNEAAVKCKFGVCTDLLREAAWNLKILGPENGKKELIELVAAELAKLSQPLRKPQPETRHPKL